MVRGIKYDQNICPRLKQCSFAIFTTFFGLPGFFRNCNTVFASVGSPTTPRNWGVSLRLSVERKPDRQFRNTHRFLGSAPPGRLLSYLSTIVVMCSGSEWNGSP